MIKDLRKKFIRITMFAVAMVMILLCLIVNAANYLSVNSEINQKLDMIYENQGTIPMPAKDGKPPEAAGGGPFSREEPYSTRYFVLKFDDRGNLSEKSLEHIAAVTESDVDEFLEVAVKAGGGYGYYSGYKYYVAQQGENRNIAIFIDCYDDLRKIYTVGILSIAAMAVCIVLVYVIVVMLSGRVVEPMIKNEQKQKQFITDAGHELKTPITVIATSLTVLEMEVGKQKWIDKAMLQTEKLKNLVNSLVSLAKMDEGTAVLKKDTFNISDAIADTAQSFADFAGAQGHRLDISVAPGIRYTGDEYAVRQLVSVLIDNAVKYAEPDTDIYFKMKKDKKGVSISTRNACSGITAEDTKRLFDRFYRPDKSRNNATGGFGIGLSLARSIAEGHNGSIYANLPEDNIIEFTAELR